MNLYKWSLVLLIYLIYLPTWAKSLQNVPLLIAIIDTGIDKNHPGFQDATLVAPQNFPKVSHDALTAATNNKIIVVRSYENLFGFAETLLKIVLIL